MSISEALGRAMARANPDQDGSLMRELRREGVVGIVDEVQQHFNPRPERGTRRSKYVQGWRAEIVTGADK